MAFEEWTEIFGSERLTGALLARLTHRCHILELMEEAIDFDRPERDLTRNRQPGRIQTRNNPQNERTKSLTERLKLIYL
jgi:hypothetical protein